jgi:hypothetical protein
MLLECKVHERGMLVLDAETVGGIDKSVMSTTSHPDVVVEHAVEMIRSVANSFGEALSRELGDPPSEMSVQFAIKVDSNSVVQVARRLEDGQFRVTLRWSD